jgi:hypothetical protein
MVLCLQACGYNVSSVLGRGGQGSRMNLLRVTLVARAAGDGFSCFTLQ